MNGISPTWMFWTVPVFVVLGISLLSGPSTLFDVFINTLLGSVLPLGILAFTRGDGMSDRGFAVLSLTLSAIPVFVILTAPPDGWFAYPMAMLGAGVGAAAALRYDNRSQEQNKAPRIGLLILYILGGTILGYVLLALVLQVILG